MTNDVRRDRRTGLGSGCGRPGTRRDVNGLWWMAVASVVLSAVFARPVSCNIVFGGRRASRTIDPCLLAWPNLMLYVVGFSEWGW